MRVLVVNAGSSSLKLTLLDGDDRVIDARELDTDSGDIDAAAVREALDNGLGDADTVGHRIVHGGERFVAATLIDEDVKAALRALSDLAPLHQAKSLAALDAVSTQLPNIPAVACFDTAFHANLPEAARTYALPAAWRERWPIRRYGFHGLSHGWVAHRASEMLGLPPGGLRLVSCHLGAGASLCAISDGRSVDTTMGFTPLEGLVMATRSGDVDPGLLLWLMQHGKLTESDLAAALGNAALVANSTFAHESFREGCRIHFGFASTFGGPSSRLKHVAGSGAGPQGQRHSERVRSRVMSEVGPKHHQTECSQFEVRLRTHRRTALVELFGELDLVTVAQVGDAFDSLDVDGDGLSHVVLDLRGLTFMDVTGIHEIVRQRKAADKHRRNLSVVRGPASITRLMEITAVDRLLVLVEHPADLIPPPCEPTRPSK